MDDLTYTYDNTGGVRTNRLTTVQGASNSTTYTTDFKGTGHYSYDKIGNLITETPNGASRIRWTVYGKIRSIELTGGGSLSYYYDAGGNRVRKVYNKPEGGTAQTWYVRDAQGNPLATYSQDDNNTVKWSEQHLYGSSRLGLWNPELDITSLPDAGESAWLLEGNKRYELTNHLGNVLAVLSDKKIGASPGEYTAEVMSMQDYYPFGMVMVGRSFNVGSYRYGFNGKENDNEVKGEGNQQDYGMRIYDTRIGRFLSIDPLTKDFAYYSPFHFAGNNPIYNVDLDGKEPKSYMWELIKLGKEVPLKWGYMVQQVRDPLDQQIYTIMHYPNSSRYFSWKNNNGTDGVFTGDNMQDGKWTGYWQEYVLPEVKYAATLAEVADGLGQGLSSTLVGGAGGVALSGISAASAGFGFVGKGLLSSTLDGVAQLAANGGKFGDVNLTSLATSFAFQNPTWGNVLAKNTLSNSFLVNASGYHGFGSEGTSDLAIMGNIAIGVAFDKTVGVLQGLPSKYTSAQVSRFKSLSYKPKYAAQFREYLIKQRISETLSSAPGTLGTGIVNNASSIEIKDDQKTN